MGQSSQETAASEKKNRKTSKTSGEKKLFGKHAELKNNNAVLCAKLCFANFSASSSEPE